MIRVAGAPGRHSLLRRISDGGEGRRPPSPPSASLPAAAGERQAPASRSAAGRPYVRLRWAGRAAGRSVLRAASVAVRIRRLGRPPAARTAQVHRGESLAGGVGDDVGAGHREAAAAGRPRAAAGERRAGGGGVGLAAARGGGAGERGKVRLRAEGEAPVEARRAAGRVVGVDSEDGAVRVSERRAGGACHTQPRGGQGGGGEEAAAEHVGGEEGVGVAAAAVAVDRDGAGRGVDGRDEAVEHLRRAERVGGGRRVGSGRFLGPLRWSTRRIARSFRFRVPGFGGGSRWASPWLFESLAAFIFSSRALAQTRLSTSAQGERSRARRRARCGRLLITPRTRRVDRRPGPARLPSLGLCLLVKPE